MTYVPNYVTDFFRANRVKVRPMFVCKDAVSFSVQASDFHYSSPRDHLADWYTMVEVHPFGATFRSFGKKDSPGGVYPFVPIGKVNAVIHKHGGPL